MRHAFFRFEASGIIGAGHAIRSSVLADVLTNNGWLCEMVTSAESYTLIKSLARFKRIDPNQFYRTPITCDLLVIDHHDLDATYETHFRHTTKKIMVIDDLANRKHDCDILLDQNYGRKDSVYKPLVPAGCRILTGSKYVLLRPEFARLRAEALEKRRNTTKIERILISMGGGDFPDYILKALDLIKESKFTGTIDIVLGFHASGEKAVRAYLKSLPNIYTIHINADMPKLMYAADLVIGAGGSSVWERCCLGLPQLLYQIADNQTIVFEKMKKFAPVMNTKNFLQMFNTTNYQEKAYASSKIVDGLGADFVYSLAIK